jgi:fatty-acyl-CoA synthase
MDALPVLLPTRFWEVPAHHALLRPEAAALRSADGDIGYAALTARVDQCAATLWHGWGVRAGDRVAWLGFNGPGQLVLLFALARIGGALLPLNYRLTPADWLQQLRDCGASHLVHDDDWTTQANGIGAAGSLPVHAVADIDGTDHGDVAPQAGEAQSLALLVYTSGTSGAARAAVHTQANLLANMRSASQAQDMTSKDRVLTVLPLFHVGGLCIQTLPALYAGGCVTLHPRFDAGAVLAALARERPSLTLQVPATMKALVDHPDWPATDLSGLRAVWAGSSVLPPALVRAFLQRGVPLCNVYGATETGPFSVALPPRAAASHAGSCGWPAPEVEVTFVTRDASSGELLVRGPNVVRHYWPATPACDAGGWFHTGDLAVRADDGSYTIVGRARDLIISGGENIHPADVESVVGDHPAVAECAAFGVPDERWGERVAIAVVLRPGAALPQALLQLHLEGRLARFKWPRQLLVVDALPKTAVGKVQRHALVDMARGRMDPGSSPG